MSDLITRTARLVPYLKRPKQVPSFVTAYSYEPLPDEPGADLGSLYVVMEVLVSGRASEEIADLIIETFGEEYYNQSHSDRNALAHFEAAVKAINHELSEYVNRGNAAWIGKLSAAIAVQASDEVHVAQTGSAEAFLYRGKAVTRIGGTGAGRPATPSKTFGSIATGLLESGDRLLLATPALIHQVPLAKLQTIVSGSSPSAAISEITELLRGVAVERIAALVVEITTPELAALQIRSEQPDEIQLGSPESALDAAKSIAAPIAKSTVEHGIKVADAAQAGWQRARPRASALGLALADQARGLLGTKGGRRFAMIVLLCVVFGIGLLSWHANSSAQTSKTMAKYQAAYQTTTQAQQLLNSNDKSGARTDYEAASKQLDSLKGNQGSINAKLAHMALPESEPKTFTALYTQIANQIDQIDGLVRVTPTTVATLAARNSKPEHFEIFENKAYIFDSGNHNALSIVDLSTGSVFASSAGTSKIGVVVNTTLSSANDGIFILTAQPSVWFYRFSTDTVTQQTIAYGQWPKASAIASYASNLYLLGDNAVYKHIKNATGFSPKTAYIDTSIRDSNATALAVDGSIYLLSPAGLHEYVSGSLLGSSPVPSTLPGITNLRSTANGAVVIGTSTASNRVAIWKVGSSGLEFSKQLDINGLKNLYDATYDPALGSVYAVADGKLVRFAVSP